MIKRVLMLVGALALLLGGPVARAQILFTASMDSSQEAPPTKSTGQATAWVLLSADMTSLTYQVTSGSLVGGDCMQYFLINQFLLIFMMMPLIIPTSIAAYSIVGEKTTRSLEPLLATPLTNTELYIGKAVAATLPPLLASYLGMFIYVGGLIFGEQRWRPELMLVIQILLLTTAQALVMVEDQYPEPAQISNIADAQAINPASDFVLTWNPVAGAAANDRFRFYLYESPAGTVLVTSARLESTIGGRSLLELPEGHDPVVGLAQNAQAQDADDHQHDAAHRRDHGDEAPEPREDPHEAVDGEGADEERNGQ